jgi:hypothetical protein
MDPDPGCPKTCGSGTGSGSPTLVLGHIVPFLSKATMIFKADGKEKYKSKKALAIRLTLPVFHIKEPLSTLIG